MEAIDMLLITALCCALIGTAIGIAYIIRVVCIFITILIEAYEDYREYEWSHKKKK
jgi:hypothetical protein